jgi:hypothetical protein
LAIGQSCHLGGSEREQAAEYKGDDDDDYNLAGQFGVEEFLAIGNSLGENGPRNRPFWKMPQRTARKKLPVMQPATCKTTSF